MSYIDNFVTKVISKSIDSLNVFFSLKLWYIAAVKAVAEPPYTQHSGATQVVGSSPP